jgi:hypothetical protein
MNGDGEKQDFLALDLDGDRGESGIASGGGGFQQMQLVEQQVSVEWLRFRVQMGRASTCRSYTTLSENARQHCVVSGRITNLCRMSEFAYEPSRSFIALNNTLVTISSQQLQVCSPAPDSYNFRYANERH